MYTFQYSEFYPFRGGASFGKLLASVRYLVREDIDLLKFLKKVFLKLCK